MDTIAINPEPTTLDGDTGAAESPADQGQLFHTLVTRHRARLHRFVMRHIGHYDDAHDIAQQAFAAAAHSIEQFRGESELSTWLYGIAMNLVRNYLNRAPQRLYQFVSDDLLAEMPCSPHDDPLDTVARRQMVSKLLESMEGMPQSMQEVLIMVGVEELSYEEAAAALSVPVGTVRSRLSRARATLRARLHGDEDPDPQELW